VAGTCVETGKSVGLLTGTCVETGESAGLLTGTCVEAGKGAGLHAESKITHSAARHKDRNTLFIQASFPGKILSSQIFMIFIYNIDK
jgi:hypothetical protein